MSKSPDVWFVRLPTGSVLRANSTAVVRDHLASGRIPRNSRVRRSTGRRWRGLAQTAEFADLAAPRGGDRRGSRITTGLHTASTAPLTLEPATVASRLDPVRLPTVRVRGMLQELLAALESTLVRTKLGVAAAASLVGGLVVALLGSGLLDPLLPGPVLQGAVAGVVLLLVAAVASSLLGQTTFVELSRLRPAKWREASAGLGRLVPRVFLVYLLATGGTLAAIALLRWLPSWLLGAPDLARPDGMREGVAGAVAVLAVVLEVVLWAV